MASNYYYLVSSLPELDFEEGVRFLPQSPQASQESEGRPGSAEFLQEAEASLREGLSENDREALLWLSYPVDNRNFITAYCNLKRPFVEGGNYSQEEIHQMIEQPGDFPEYLQHFYDLYAKKNETEKLPANFLEDRLAGLFYDEVLVHPVKYLRLWFSFELDLNNLLSTMQIRRFGMALEKRETPRPGQKWAASLVGDRDSNRAMQESKAYDFGLSGEFSWIPRILNIEKAPPAVLDQGIEKLRWEMAHEICRELTGEEIFSLEYTLSYFIRLQIIRRRLVLSAERGEERLKVLGNSLAKSALEIISRQEQEAQNTKEAG